MLALRIVKICLRVLDGGLEAARKVLNRVILGAKLLLQDLDFIATAKRAVLLIVGRFRWARIVRVHRFPPFLELSADPAKTGSREGRGPPIIATAP
jgi:hypothetical protein